MKITGSVATTQSSPDDVVDRDQRLGDQHVVQLTRHRRYGMLARPGCHVAGHQQEGSEQIDQCGPDEDDDDLIASISATLECHGEILTPHQGGWPRSQPRVFLTTTPSLTTAAIPVPASARIPRSAVGSPADQHHVGPRTDGDLTQSRGTVRVTLAGHAQ